MGPSHHSQDQRCPLGFLGCFWGVDPGGSELSRGNSGEMRPRKWKAWKRSGKKLWSPWIWGSKAGAELPREWCCHPKVIPGMSPALWEPQSWTCIPKHGFFFQAFPPFPLSWLGFPALFHLQGVFPREGRGGTKGCSSKPTPTEPKAPPKPRELGEFLGLGLVPAS